MGILEKKIFLKLFQMEQNSFHLIEKASEMSKITLSVSVYAPCLNKTTIKTNKKQINSSADTFFLITRYLGVEILVKIQKLLKFRKHRFRKHLKIVLFTDVRFWKRNR